MCVRLVVGGGYWVAVVPPPGWGTGEGELWPDMEDMRPCSFTIGSAIHNTWATLIHGQIHAGMGWVGDG